VRSGAAIVAEALVATAATSRADRRIVARELVGAGPESVHEALMALATDSVTIAGLGDAGTLAAVAAGPALLIPYLVSPPGESGTNRGSSGFAARIRTALAASPAGPAPRVFLVFDRQPPETIATAAERAERLPELSWAALCRRAAAPARGSAAGPLLDEVARDAGATGAEDPDRLAILGSLAESPADAGATGGRLYELGIYLSDPSAPRDPRRRLQKGREWRRRIERLILPGRRLTEELASLRVPSATVARIVAATGPSGTDFSRFTLDDLNPVEGERPPAFQRPLSATGAVSQLSFGSTLAVWVDPSATSISLALEATAVAGDITSAAWSGSRGATASLSGGEQAARVRLPNPRPMWAFGRVELRRGRAAADSIDVALYTSPSGRWFPVEAGGELALPVPAFRVHDEPRVLAVAREGGVLGAAEVHLTDDSGPAPVAVTASAMRDGEEHSIPLLLSGEPVGGPGGGNGEPGEGEPEPGEGSPEPGDGGEDDPDPFGGAARGSLAAGESHLWPSPVHGLVERASAAADGRAAGPFRFQSDGADAFISIGTVVDRLAEQRLGAGGLNGLALERAIIARPEIWSYLAEAGGTRVEVSPNLELEMNRLDSLSPTAVARFASARMAFFEALRPAGSVYAVACGTAVAEAEAYVEAYRSLLDEVAIPGRYQPELDRLLFCDLVLDVAAGEVYIAPTNPLTVAFYLQLAGTARDWIDRGESGEGGLALRSVSPQFLMPIANLAGEWFEAGEPGPFLWRSLIPLTAGGVAPGRDGTVIARRLGFFLRVHAAYQDPKQRVRLSIHEPGTGEAVVDALERFYGPDLKQEIEYRQPRLEIEIVTSRGELPPAVENLFTGDAGGPLHRLIRSRVGVSATGRATGFRHVSFVYTTPAARTPRSVRLDSRASSFFAGGLAAAPGRWVQSSVNERLFAWGLFPGSDGMPEAEGSGRLRGLVTRSLELVGGQPRDLMSPGVTRMPATSIGRDFMGELYRDSAWVVHLDRQLGLEAFAPWPGTPARYIVDYSEMSDRGRPAFDGITATELLEPYREAIEYALRDLGPVTDAGLNAILSLLNSVSGGWAIDVLRQPPHQVRERLGVLVAVTVLRDLEGTFDAGGEISVIVPLDELFAIFPGLHPHHERSNAADDLAVLTVTPGAAEALVTARIIEVKYRTVGGPDYGAARQQILNTQERLSDFFEGGGPAALFRARDLAEAIRAAASRATSFGLAPHLDGPKLERSLDLVSRGRFRLEASYLRGAAAFYGDVVSVEAESTAEPAWSLLPGAGPACGLIRAGRPALTALASGLPLRSPAGWVRSGVVRPPAPASGGRQAGDRAAPSSESERASEPVRPTPPPRHDQAAAAAMSDEVAEMAARLDGAVLKYELSLEPFSPERAQVGPSVIRFRSRPLGRQSLDGVARRAADIGREIGVPEGVLVDQEAFYITIDVPRRERAVVPYAEFEQLLDASGELGSLRFLLGIEPSGEVSVEDLARLPHLLVAGATGSGKSVFLRCLLLSLLHRPPSELQILLIDPKQVDFLPFEDIPHLVGGRIVFDPVEAVSVLSELIASELERRRPILKAAGVTSALEFYEAGGSLQELPQMVVLVDEFADLAATLGREDRAAFLSLIQRYGQLTRAFGIYLVLATQRPSVQVITGEIKANLTARVALRVQAFQDSMTILGRAGAESLRDKGDLIFEHGGRSRRLQGFIAYPADVAAAVRRWGQRR
jgi:hypothetical protein